MATRWICFEIPLSTLWGFASNSVTLVTIQGAHTLDLAIAVLGELANVTVLNTTQYPEVEIGNWVRRSGRAQDSENRFLFARTERGQTPVRVVGGNCHDCQADIGSRRDACGLALAPATIGQRRDV